MFFSNGVESLGRAKRINFEEELYDDEAFMN
jgi:hypothetical protein